MRGYVAIVDKDAGGCWILFRYLDVCLPFNIAIFFRGSISY